MTALRTAIHRKISHFSIFMGKTCGIFYLVAIGLSFLEVFNRYALDAPSVWNLEIVMALCATAWLLSGAPVTQQYRHITVTVLEIVLGEKTWKLLSRLANLIALVAVIGLMWACWEGFLHSFQALERSGSAVNTPYPSYIRVLLIFALGVYALQLFANLLAPAKGQEHVGRNPEDIKNEVME